MDHVDADLICGAIDRLEAMYRVFENLATMGITAGLFKVAEAVRDLASAVSDLKNNSDS